MNHTESATEERVTSVLFDAVDEVNAQLPSKKKVHKSTDTLLTGPTGSLDSLGLVNLIVAVEQRVEEAFETPISLGDERAASHIANPFESIRTLRDYICLLLEDNTNAKPTL